MKVKLIEIHPKLNKNNNNNLLNGPLCRSTWVIQYQEKHSLAHTLSLWLLYNIF